MHLSNDFANIDANNDGNIDSDEIKAFEKKLNNPDIKEHHIQQIFSNQEMLDAMSPLFSNVLSKIVDSYKANGAISESDILILQTYAVTYHGKTRTEVGMIEESNIGTETPDRTTTDTMELYLIGLLEGLDIPVMKLRDDFNTKFSVKAENIYGLEISVLPLDLVEMYSRYLDGNDNAFEGVFESDSELSNFLKLMKSDIGEQVINESISYYYDRQLNESLNIDTTLLNDNEVANLSILKGIFEKAIQDIKNLETMMRMDVYQKRKEILASIGDDPDLATDYALGRSDGEFEKIKDKYNGLIIDKLKGISADYGDYMIDLGILQGYMRHGGLATIKIGNFELNLDFDKFHEKIAWQDVYDNEKLKQVFRDNIDEILREDNRERLADAIGKGIQYVKDNPGKASVDLGSIIGAGLITGSVVEGSGFTSVPIAGLVFTASHDIIKSSGYCMVNEYYGNDCSDGAMEGLGISEEMSLGQMGVKKGSDLLSNTALFGIFRGVGKGIGAIRGELGKEIVIGEKSFWELIKEGVKIKKETIGKVIVESGFFSAYQTYVGSLEQIMVESMEKGYSSEEIGRLYDQKIDELTDPENVLSLYSYNLMFISAVRVGLFGGNSFRISKEGQALKNKLVNIGQRLKYLEATIRANGYRFDNILDQDGHLRIIVTDKDSKPVLKDDKGLIELRQANDEVIGITKQFLKSFGKIKGNRDKGKDEGTKEDSLDGSTVRSKHNSGRGNTRGSDIKLNFEINKKTTLQEVMTGFGKQENMENGLVNGFKNLLGKFANFPDISNIRKESEIVIDQELHKHLTYLESLSGLSILEKKIVEKFKADLPEIRERLSNEFAEAIELRIKGEMLGEKYGNEKFITEKVDMFVERMDPILRKDIRIGRQTFIPQKPIIK